MAAMERVETLATFEHKLRGVQTIRRQSECGTKRNSDRLTFICLLLALTASRHRRLVRVAASAASSVSRCALHIVQFRLLGDQCLRRVAERGRRSRGGHLYFVWCAFQVRIKIHPVFADGPHRFCRDWNKTIKVRLVRSTCFFSFNFDCRLCCCAWSLGRLVYV